MTDTDFREMSKREKCLEALLDVAVRKSQPLDSKHCALIMDSDYEEIESDGDFRADSDEGDISLSEDDGDLEDEIITNKNPSAQDLMSPIATRASRAKKPSTYSIISVLSRNAFF